jgi:antitoxin (DNA-binding transcriptional repressor) of toxin-antitoxin stability system
VPVVVTTVDNKQYLVSTLGPESNWLKDVEAGNGEAILRQGRPRSVRLVAIAPNEMAPILKCALQPVAANTSRCLSTRRCPSSS